ncbi:MAG: chromosome segregation protein SMC [Rhodoferax sp.]|nr:chromosome segregation protein SMC [Rhodoferax sp.]
MNQNWNYPGARWWKFDFHTHTPASRDTDAWQTAIGMPQELTPETWLRKYMAAEIDCVAITDHNSGDWIDKLKSAYDNLKQAAGTDTPPVGFRELYLFPGVEISVQGGIHLLAIFDPSATSRTINDLLARVNDCGTREGGAEGVKKILVAGGIVIPAHVDSAKYTWIKMAAPSLEGLRLALLDGQGVSVRRSDDSDDGDDFKPFQKPEHFIESIEIHNARFMGQGKPAVLACNPYFNALIGGRGTGKSTVVHAVRLAYQREKELPVGSEAGQTFDRFNKVAGRHVDEGGLRPETEIRVQVSRDGCTYRLTWRQDGQGHAVEEWDDTTRAFKPSGSQAISAQRFPIRLFSQGQIAALAGDSQQALLKVIDDAAGTAAQQLKFEEARQAFLATQAQMRELDGKLRARDALELSLQDVQRKLARFEGADHAAVLKNYQRTSRQGREVERQFESAADLANRLKVFAQELLAEDLPEGLFDPGADEVALQTVQKLQAAIAKARSEVEHVATTLDAQSSVLLTELSSSGWMAKVADAKAAYDKLKADLQQQGVNDPSAYGRLVQEGQRLDTEVKRLDALQKLRESLGDKAQVQLEEVRAARRAISTCRTQFLQSTLEGNPYVRMAIIPYGRDAHTMERAHRELHPKAQDDELCWFPEDGLCVEYSRKGDGRDFQSIAQASAGQRAAAMLAFLLAHGSEPLVLDQPEDDLDNHLIYGLVVQQIRANKLRRQLIIVTHNPNIVVNGDAELIHVLDFNSQCFVKQTGSLQDLAMRGEVCQVMEGGKEAFERRYQRLGGVA